MSFVLSQQDNVWIAKGSDPRFFPGGLPAPSLCLLINPNGFDDGIEKPDLQDVVDHAFEAHNVDAFLAIVEGKVADVEQGLFEQALDSDVGDHLDCDNGGLYGLWQITSDHVLVAAMDNGGSDMAQCTTEDYLFAHHKPLSRMSQSHFDAAQFAPGKDPYNKEGKAFFEQLRALLQNNELHVATSHVPATPSPSKKI